MKDAKLVNLTNHPSNKWSSEQLAFWKGTEIIDIQFPNVDCNADESIVKAMAIEYFEKLRKTGATHVMLQGEFSLCYEIFDLITRNTSIVVCIPSTERKVIETINVDGTVKKDSIFSFVRWRFI